MEGEEEVLRDLEEVIESAFQKNQENDLKYIMARFSVDHEMAEAALRRSICVFDTTAKAYRMEVQQYINALDRSERDMILGIGVGYALGTRDERAKHVKP